MDASIVDFHSNLLIGCPYSVNGCQVDALWPPLCRYPHLQATAPRAPLVCVCLCVSVYVCLCLYVCARALQRGEVTAHVSGHTMHVSQLCLWNVVTDVYFSCITIYWYLKKPACRAWGHICMAVSLLTNET